MENRNSERKETLPVETDIRFLTDDAFMKQQHFNDDQVPNLGMSLHVYFFQSLDTMHTMQCFYYPHAIGFTLKILSHLGYRKNKTCAIS